MSRLLVIGSSVVAHGLFLLGLGELRTAESHAATSIEVFEAKPQKPPPPPIAKVEPPPPKESRQLTRRAPAPAAEPEPDPTPAPENGLAALPELGLELSGGTGPGFAPPASGAGPALNRGSVAKTLKSSSNTPLPTGGCAETAGKPKLVSLPQPGYTEQARAAAVEGKVRVQLTVNERGEVVDVRVLAGLGHGLDEAALAAARGARFEPALRCGKPSASTFTIAMRFSAS